jgi:general secretion pathway protein C
VQAIRRLFIGSKDKGIYPWLLAACVVLLLVQAVRLAWTLLTPIGPVGAWRPVSALVMPLAERAALMSAFDPFFRNDAPEGKQAKITALNLTLFGTTVNQSTGGGSAILAGEDGVQMSIATGEDILPGVTLFAVAHDHVVIQNGGAKERLYLDQSKPAETVGAGGAGTAPPAQGAPATDAKITADTVKAGVTLQPRTEGSAVTGLIAAPNGDGAVFGKLGLQAGDIITQVNGRPIRSTADAAALNGQLRPGARLSLTIERGAEIVPIAIILE